MNVITLTQFCKDQKVGLDTVRAAVERAKLQPQHTMRYGNGTMPLYDAEALAKSLLAHRTALEAEAAKKAAAKAPAPAPAPAADDATGLADLELKIEALRILTAESTGAIEVLTEAVGKLSGQNVLIYRAIEDACRQQAEGFAYVHTTFRRAGVEAPLAPPPPPVAVQPPPPPPPAPAPAPISARASKIARVAVVGLMPRSQRIIENEFGAVFDLRQIEGRDAKGRAFEQHIKGSDHVMFMLSFNGHSAQDSIRSAGVPMTKVHGGVESLRIAMTELYVKLTDKEAVAA